MDKQNLCDSEKVSEKQAKIVFRCMVGVAIILLFAVSGCDQLTEAFKNAKSSAVVHVVYYNENCATLAYIKGSDDKVYARDVPPGGSKRITLRRPALDQGEKVILDTRSYDPPRGCEKYGRDDKEIDFDDGEVDTEEWYIDLDPDGW